MRTDGLELLLLGNADLLDSGVWTGTPAPEPTPLPIYPTSEQANAPHAD